MIAASVDSNTMNAALQQIAYSVQLLAVAEIVRVVLPHENPLTGWPADCLTARFSSWDHLLTKQQSH